MILIYETEPRMSQDPKKFLLATRHTWVSLDEYKPDAYASIATYNWKAMEWT